MSGRDGFSRADIDTNFFHDPKAVALARRLQNDCLTMAYLGLYQATVLASWKAGHRVTLIEAAPAWWLSNLGVPETELRAVDLLDDEGRVLEHAFEAWAGRLIDALDKAAAAGREGARRRWHPDRPPIGSPLVPDGDPIAPPMHQPARQTDRQKGDARENGAAPPPPSAPGQIVRRWLTDHGASRPTGFVNTDLNELVKVYGHEAIIAIWEKAPPDRRTSKEWVKLAERELSPGSRAASAKGNGSHGAEAAVEAFSRG